MRRYAFLVPRYPEAPLQIENQRKVLAGIEPFHLVSMSVAYGLMALFLPAWVPLIAMVCDLFFEMTGLRLMQGLDPRQQPIRYNMVLLAVFLMELSYSLPCLAIWQNDDRFAKATAVALLLMTLFQLCSMRSLHLPFGVAGWASVSATTLLGNGLYWFESHDLVGFSLSTLGIVAAMLFTMGAMRSNHFLHQEINKRGMAADAANHAKGRFMAQMSHELRTPLNAILGMGEAELAQTNDTETKARMATLVSSTKGLAVILDDILEMTALDEAALQIRPVPIVPAGVITAVADIFRTLADRSGLWMQVEISDGLRQTALMDPNRLRQCLSNLLSNALKYTERGGVRLTAVLSPRGELQVDIIDTGAGIAPQARDKLFTPFQRGNAAQQGSGLGLAISRGLARQMGGDLLYLPTDAPNGVGAHFRLILPMPFIKAVVDATVAAPPVNAKGKRILVVDDIATNRLVASTYLRLMNALPEEAASGAEALAAIVRNPPDLILLDMNMPQLSGLETLAVIRRLCGGRVLPILAMTADASAADRQRYLAAGLDGIIAKPLTPASVALALAAHMPRLLNDENPSLAAVGNVTGAS
jgi:signal transduction histidine kinase/ActR/RegA family two-component response regulator